MMPTLGNSAAPVPHQHIIVRKRGSAQLCILMPSPWSIHCICSRCAAWQYAWPIADALPLTGPCPGGAPRTYSEESRLFIALLRTLWRLSYQDMRDWLRDWPALALACDLPLGKDGSPSTPERCESGSAA
jgi:hypothetical protein